MSRKDRYVVEDLFPVYSKNYLTVHIKSDEWSLRGGREATLIFGEKFFVTKYSGFGNVNGKLILMLISQEEELTNIFCAFKNSRKDNVTVYLEL